MRKKLSNLKFRSFCAIFKASSDEVILSSLISAHIMSYKPKPLVSQKKKSVKKYQISQIVGQINDEFIFTQLSVAQVSYTVGKYMV